MLTERRELQGERLERPSRPKHQVQIRVRPTAASSEAGAPANFDDTPEAEVNAGRRDIVPVTT
jgi:hypothetical protein